MKIRMKIRMKGRACRNIFYVQNLVQCVFNCSVTVLIKKCSIVVLDFLPYGV